MKLYYAYTMCGNPKTEIYSNLEKAKIGLAFMIRSTFENQNHTWKQAEDGDWIYSTNGESGIGFGGCVQEYEVKGEVKDNYVFHVQNFGINQESEIFSDMNAAIEWLKAFHPFNKEKLQVFGGNYFDVLTNGKRICGQIRTYDVII